MIDENQVIEHAEALLELFERPSLWIALRGIAENPQHELRVSTPFVDLGEARELEASMLGLATFEAGSLSITNRMRHFKAFDRKWRFLKVFDRRIERYDLTPANQFVAFFVRYAIKRLREFMASLPRTEDFEAYIPPFFAGHTPA